MHHEVMSATLRLQGYKDYFSTQVERSYRSDRPEMAQRIIEKLYGCYEDGAEEGWGYHVTFEEVFENAKEIIQLKDYYMPGNSNSTMVFF